MVARRGPIARGVITAVLPAASSSKTRLSAISVSASRVQEVVCSHQVVRFAAGQEECRPGRQRVDQGVDLGAQSVAGSTDPRRLFSAAGAMLAGAHNAAVDHRVFVVASAECWNTRSQHRVRANG